MLELIVKAPNKYFSDYSGSLVHLFTGDVVNNDSDTNNNHLLNGHYMPDVVLDSLQIPSNSILMERS